MSTMHTEREHFAASIRAALAHTELLPFSSSTPQKTTDLGASQPGAKKMRCTICCISLPKLSLWSSLSMANALAAAGRVPVSDL
jgi:hypothetical protein